MKWRYPLRIILLPAIILLTGCLFEDNDEDSIEAPAISVGGAGVKGPLVGAEVNLYLLDLSAADLKGNLQDSGTTGSNAAIQDLEVPDDISGLVLLEFAVIAGTTDLTTGAAPIFNNLVTVVDAQRILDGDDVYASVLTNMVVNLARRKADSGSPYSGDGNGSITTDEFNAALVVAQRQVKSTLGFGLSDSTDIFTTPPLVTNDTTTSEQQAAVAAYRQAIEGVAAIAAAVSDSGGGANAQEAFDALTEDLSDGVIDGQSDTGAVAAFAAVTATLQTTVTQDISSLVIPGTTTTVGSITSVLASEAATTGTTTDTTDLGTGNVEIPTTPAVVEVDSDGDGTIDSEDAFPVDADNQTDADQDGFGDQTDDAFPNDPDNQTDADMDGFGDETDDVFPDDPDNYSDADQDGFGDQTDDAFPNDPDNQTDADQDGFGDETDDAFPNDPDNYSDADMDGLGDQTLDQFLNDTDNDGIINEEDDFPNVPNDSDNDGVADDTDNCVDVFNPDQANEDGDAAGDACDGPSTAVWNQFNWDEAAWQ